jgi:hypothetical protein
MYEFDLSGKVNEDQEQKAMHTRSSPQDVGGVHRIVVTGGPFPHSGLTCRLKDDSYPAEMLSAQLHMIAATLASLSSRSGYAKDNGQISSSWPGLVIRAMGGCKWQLTSCPATISSTNALPSRDHVQTGRLSKRQYRLSDKRPSPSTFQVGSPIFHISSPYYFCNDLWPFRCLIISAVFIFLSSRHDFSSVDGCPLCTVYYTIVSEVPKSPI